jgi:alkanesulfonate monooxygenase SsuD/methylene tetrahydromethanopterin reductase-like flavin-dependent oxidoreductase (luciferase family)
MMKYGLDISPAGDWGRPDQIAELAALSEDHGWDGVFCEDYLAFPGGRPTYDVWITLGLVAHATTRLTLGTMVTPLPRRHTETVALQAMSVDHVSGGRLVLGVGTGDSQGDLAGMTRGGPGQRSGAILDEALDLVCRLWSGDRVSHSGEGYLVDGARLVPPPVQRPRIPIWVGGAITKQAPRDRALRWDGACLYRVPPPDWEDLTPVDVAKLRADAGRSSYAIAVGGRERREDLVAERRYVASLAEAGADWWHEYVPPRLTLTEARRRIESGPLRA